MVENKNMKRVSRTHPKYAAAAAAVATAPLKTANLSFAVCVAYRVAEAGRHALKSVRDEAQQVLHAGEDVGRHEGALEVLWGQRESGVGCHRGVGRGRKEHEGAEVGDAVPKLKQGKKKCVSKE